MNLQRRLELRERKSDLPVSSKRDASVYEHWDPAQPLASMTLCIRFEIEPVCQVSKLVLFLYLTITCWQRRWKVHLRGIKYMLMRKTVMSDEGVRKKASCQFAERLRGNERNLTLATS